MPDKLHWNPGYSLLFPVRFQTSNLYKLHKHLLVLSDSLFLHIPVFPSVLLTSLYHRSYFPWLYNFAFSKIPEPIYMVFVHPDIGKYCHPKHNDIRSIFHWYSAISDFLPLLPADNPLLFLQPPVLPLPMFFQNS